MTTILITGAAGLFGGILRQHWGDRYRLRLADVQPVTDLAAHETFVETDITDPEQLRLACQGVDTIVHLAAYPGDGAPFYDTLMQLNVIGAYNAFEAARFRARCDLDQVAYLHVMLPWLIDHIAETKQVMGDDYWTYGVDGNRKTIDTMCRYAFEQGLTDRKIAIEELFAPE